MKSWILELGTAIIWGATMIAYTIVENTSITGNLALVFIGGFILQIIFIRTYQGKVRDEK